LGCIGGGSFVESAHPLPLSIGVFLKGLSAAVKNVFLRRIAAILFRNEQKQRLTLLVVAVLAVSFLGTAVLSYLVSRERMRDLIVSSELPLTSDTVYSAIQRDFMKPIQASSLMASDTFLRDWALNGEKDLSAIQKFLDGQQRVVSAFTAYFVSATTHNYYVPNGILKTVSTSDEHDIWFFDLQKTNEPYVVQVDTDQNNNNALTVFINYRVYDYQHRFIGITGMGLNVDAVRDSMARYQTQFGRKIYFVDKAGKPVMWAGKEPPFVDIAHTDGLAEVAHKILSDAQSALSYRAGDQTHLLNVRYVPELNWYLFVERIEEVAMENIRHTLYVNLLIALFATAVVAIILSAAVNHFHFELDKFATTDGLTGLTNRRAFDLLFRQEVRRGRRGDKPLSLVLFDIDHFKQVNDKYGHLAGDEVIKAVSGMLSARCRASDIACRWGGEELLLLLQDCGLEKAAMIADGIRQEIGRTSIQTDAGSVTVTISVGVAEMASGETEDSVLARADRALYSAKRAGRNRVVHLPIEMPQLQPA